MKTTMTKKRRRYIPPVAEGKLCVCPVEKVWGNNYGISNKMMMIAMMMMTTTTIRTATTMMMKKKRKNRFGPLSVAAASSSVANNCELHKVAESNCVLRKFFRGVSDSQQEWF
jgi:hypothetical protein